MANLNEQIKKVAMDAVTQSEPSTFVYGTVASINPLQVQVDQKMLLTKEFLVLTKNVMDYEIQVEMEWMTEIELEHKHKVQGTKKIKIKNGLQAGNKVILVKQQGGQKYLVLDKVMS